MGSKKKAASSFSVGDLVFAKVKGYPAWPAKIIADKGQRYDVFFYGTYETGTVKNNEMWLYNEQNKAKYGKPNKKKNFPEALIEIETNPDVDKEIENTEDRIELDETQPDDEPEESAPLVTPKSSVKRPNKRTMDETILEPEDEPEESAPLVTPKNSVKRPNKRTMDESFSTPQSANKDKASRSGRPIKDKKPFTPSKSVTPVSPRSGQKKMWVLIKSTNELIELNLDQYRPIEFESKEMEIQWERATALNALKLKAKIESGLFLPDEVRRALEAKVALNPEEEKILNIQKLDNIRKDKLHFLNTEQQLIDIDFQIRKSLNINHPDLSTALNLITELEEISISPLMFKKRPQIVDTIRKLRKYVGPAVESPDPKETKHWIHMAEQIRLSANTVFKKIRDAFGHNDGNTANFFDYFHEKVDEFNKVTSSMDTRMINHLVKDPVKTAA